MHWGVRRAPCAPKWRLALSAFTILMVASAVAGCSGVGPLAPNAAGTAANAVTADSPEAAGIYPAEPVSVEVPLPRPRPASASATARRDGFVDIYAYAPPAR